jgi:serine/threonine protein kinase/Tfp pilus assembly protein PilF
MPPAYEDKRFRMIAPLGRGGTADVARVYVGDLGCEAALKYPLPDNSSSAINFASLSHREYDLIGGQRFPGLVRLIELPHTDPDYLLMELCEGHTLDSIGRVEDLSAALRLLSAVALSLEYLRACHLVHGDLKPQNIFLPRGWDRISGNRLFYAKLSDFSLGRKTEEPESSRAGLGTVGYMAPEVIGQTITSHQSDLFAFGVIAYQVLTGVHPFLKDDAEPVRVNGRVQEELVPSVETFRSELVGHPVTALVEQLLAKQSPDRPATAYDVCLALEEAGSTYPFRRGIRPGHLTQSDDSFAAASERILELSSTDRRQLLTFTGEDVRHLTLLLSGNFSQGNLEYRRGQFRFVSGVRWPAYLRRGLWAGFTQSSLARRRQLILQSVSHETNGVTPTELPLLALLRHLLKTSTVRRISRQEAPKAERVEEQSRTAVLWLQAGNLEGAERCAFQAATLLAKESRWQESLETLERVIDFARMRSQVHKVSELLLLAGNVLKQSGDTVSAEQAYLELIAALESRPTEKSLGIVYNQLADLYKMRSDFEAGLAALRKALPIYEQLGYELEFSRTCNNLGNMYWVIGDLKKSAQQFRRALRLQRKLNSQTDIATTLSNLGGILCMIGKIKRGLFLMHTSLKIKRELGNAGEIARTLNNLGYVSYITGENVRAVEYLNESLELNRRTGSRKEILINIENLTSIMISAGQLGESLSLLREGLDLSREISDHGQEMLLQISLAGTLIRLGKPGESSKVLEDVRTRREYADDHAIGINFLCAAAEFHILLGRFDEAAALVEEARAAASAATNVYHQLQTVLMLARLKDIPGLDAEVEQLILQSKFERMRTVYRFNQAERLIRHGDHKQALVRIAELLPTVLSLRDDVEMPRLCLIAAECLQLAGRPAEARQFADRARVHATQYGLVPESLMCGVISGRLALDSGDYEKAFHEFRQSIQIAKDISQSITNVADREDFQKRREIGFMVEEIGRLGLILGQKKSGRF